MSWVQNGAWWHYVTRPWWDRRWRRGFLVGAVLGVLVGVLASWALRGRSDAQRLLDASAEHLERVDRQAEAVFGDAWRKARPAWK